MSSIAIVVRMCYILLWLQVVFSRSELVHVCAFSILVNYYIIYLCCFQGYRFNFDILDRKGGAGWDLARKLICRRNAINRGRLSAASALAHKFFRPEL